MKMITAMHKGLGKKMYMTALVLSYKLCFEESLRTLENTVGSLYPRMQNPHIWRAHRTTAFYVKDWSIHRFWCSLGFLEPISHGYQGRTLVAIYY